MEFNLEELRTSTGKLRSVLSASLRKNFKTDEGTYMYVQEVFIEHPVLGTSAIITVEDVGMYVVAFSEVANGVVQLASTNEWKPVTQEYVLVPTSMPQLGQATPTQELLTEDFSESVSVEIEEVMSESTDMYSPLTLTLRIIKEGFGNERDNNYYSAEQLRKDAEKFVGKMMYTTNHKVNETNERNQVAQITEAGYDDKYKGIVAKAVVFDPMFARKTRNRSQVGMLNELHCSITSRGTKYAKPFVKDGRKGSLVKEFTKVNTVDFVSRAGAGGMALSMTG